MNTIPTISQIKTSLLNNLAAEYSIATNPYGLAVLTPLCAVLAACIWLYYISLGDVQKNIWFDTADSVANGGTLERFGNSILGRYPYAAQPGLYTVSVTGSAGAIIPGTTVFKSDDTALSPGALFEIYGGAYTMTGTGDTIQVQALQGGNTSRLAVGNTLTATSPIVNVNASATVTVENTAPIDAETIEAYREKITEKVQLEPGSWSAVDYRLVGVNVDGVGQTYAYATSGQNSSVNVFLQGTTPVANPGPSVSSTVITNYTNALNLVLPLGVFQVNVASCPINNIAITITAGSFPAMTSAQQALVTSALTTFVNGITPYIAAADSASTRNDIIATYNLITTINAAVPGVGFSGVTFTVAATGYTEWQADNGNIAFLESVTFI